MIELNFLTWYLPDRKRRKQKKMAQLLGFYLLPVLSLLAIFTFTQRDIHFKTQANEIRQKQIHRWEMERTEYQKSHPLPIILRGSKSYRLNDPLSACFDALDRVHRRTDGLYSFEIHPPNIVLKMTTLRSNIFFNLWLKPWLEKTCMNHLSLSVEAGKTSEASSLFVIQGVLKGFSYDH